LNRSELIGVLLAQLAVGIFMFGVAWAFAIQYPRLSGPVYTIATGIGLLLTTIVYFLAHGDQEW